MDIAVTGASGLIGTALTAALRADGHVVRPLVRRPSDDAHAVRWDPAAGTIDAAGLEGVEAVVHLAGVGIGDKRWTEARKAEIERSRTQGTDLLARTLAGLDAPPSVLLSGSAIGYYGNRGDEELTEASSPGDDFLAGLVQRWEAATAPAEAAGIRVVHLRTGIVLTARGGALGRLLPMLRLGIGGPLGSGRQWWSWISLDDEVGAIRHLMTAGDLSGPVNLVAPEPATNADVTKALGHALHRPALVPVPRFGPALLFGSEMNELVVFASQRIVGTKLAASGYAFAHPGLPSAADAVAAGR
jgi:hypothetical protein